MTQAEGKTEAALMASGTQYAFIFILAISIVGFILTLFVTPAKYKE